MLKLPGKLVRWLLDMDNDYIEPVCSLMTGIACVASADSMLRLAIMYLHATKGSATTCLQATHIWTKVECRKHSRGESKGPAR